MLAIAVCAVLVLLAYPLRLYVQQRQTIGELQRRTQAQAERVNQLREQYQRWQDPAYVKAQARQRLQMVDPGDTSFVAVVPGPAPTTQAPLVPDQTPPPTPWYDQLWRSVDGAARPRPGVTPSSVPATPVPPVTGGSGNGSATR